MVFLSQHCCPFFLNQVLGLGNADIIKSRHSIGMRIVAGLAPMIKSSQWIRDKELFAHTCVATLPNGKTALLVKSHLAMNDNGKTAARAGMCTKLDF